MIIIKILGGNVQNVYSDHETEYRVIDFDGEEGEYALLLGPYKTDGKSKAKSAKEATRRAEEIEERMIADGILEPD